MNRILLIFTAFVVLAGLVFGVITPMVNAQRDMVEVYEETVTGDPEAAEGLLVHLTTEYDKNLLWETDVIPGESPVSETEYQFHQFGVNFRRQSDNQTFYISTTRSYGGGEYARSGIALAFKELYDSIDEGEDMQKTVYLKDYYDYYPICGHVDLERDTFHWDASEFDVMTDEEIAESEETWVDATLFMQDYFKIPVLDNDVVTIHVTKVRGDNWAATSGYSSGSEEVYEEDSFDMFSMYARTDDAVYFTFDARSRNGVIVDVSEIKGGYGIYCLPLGTDDEGKQTVLYEELSVVAPLDPLSEKIELTMNADGTRFFLHTRENGRYVVRVYDAATGDEVQVLDVAEWGEDKGGWAVYEGEDFFVVKLTYDRIILFAENGAGEYHTPIICEIPDPDVYDHTMNMVSMDYNGEHLAFVEELRAEGYHNTLCGFSLVVYGGDGVEYYGKYRLSLGDGEGYADYDDRCNVEGYPPVTVQFR